MDRIPTSWRRRKAKTERKEGRMGMCEDRRGLEEPGTRTRHLKCSASHAITYIREQLSAGWPGNKEASLVIFVHVTAGANA